MQKEILSKTHLGKAVDYNHPYDPGLLQAIPRQLGRRELTILGGRKPFVGMDIWNAYELSWLNSKGKPEIGMAEFRFADDSQNIIESKSFKLYLNSLNQRRFNSKETLYQTLRKDLNAVVQGQVAVNILSPDIFSRQQFDELPGVCLDDLDIVVEQSSYSPRYLKTANVEVFETVYSNLFRSNCPVTQQPDWASVLIRYQGRKIEEESLLRYLLSFRQQNEFHEQCVERIFTDILYICAPRRLTVYARFTRRGGLDINPFRTNFEAIEIENVRTFRQ